MTRKDDSWKEEDVAQTYLKGVRGGIPFAAEQARIILSLLEGLPRPVARFMDIGCGDGALAAVVTGRFPEAAGTLVDFSEPMLAEARKRFEGDANIKIVKADFGKASWVERVEQEAPYDAIVSALAIHHQDDRSKRRIYKEVLSLLAPGGIFLNMEHVASPTGWVKGIADRLFIDSIFEYNRAQGGKGTREEALRDFFERPDKDANQLTPVEEQCRWLREDGYTDVDCYFKAFELAIFGGRRVGSRPEDGNR